MHSAMTIQVKTLLYINSTWSLWKQAIVIISINVKSTCSHSISMCVWWRSDGL